VTIHQQLSLHVSSCQAIDSKNAKRMQTIQELLTRGLDLDFNALGRGRVGNSSNLAKHVSLDLKTEVGIGKRR
jgi:hypothetical protein